MIFYTYFKSGINIFQELANSSLTTSKPTVRTTLTPTTPAPFINISNLLEDIAHMVLSMNTSGEFFGLNNTEAC
jgi:hypothetical protein